ncbi:MAG: 5-methyltetrahydropteroyltriglutamate--homocysteine S-methyltransferase [Rhodospirillaceae bacterium]|jgi:5-methyltetrahydropteroyltriglutamate--homocysteine methyltransferase|nr:5-methyltetrahydropteroyltriglutamate--homocysteine S-methyltransferase [Rhodospirillaceae bacterium]MBT5459442.1 5-methyltetrahydropteroyltriglutamate--homocysteine S-methyltransferase [Rhodospirillaceae bacterium]
MKGPFRADHVGSLLRPESLLEKREEWKAAKISDAELRDYENGCIADIVEKEQAVGIKSVTDGEYRRESFHFDFINQIGGIQTNFNLKSAFAQGEKTKAGGEKAVPLTVEIKDRMTLPAAGIGVENYKYLASVASGDSTPKVTMPSPTMTHFRGGRDAISREAYPELEDFFADLSALYRQEISLLAEAGCKYIQFDDTNLAYLCDTKMRQDARDRGEDPDELPRTYAALINDCIGERPDDMAACIHLCRGNARSLWFAEGDYEPIADHMFNLTDVDGFFLEYDDERSGGFEPLRYVPKGNKKIVLGLLTTKRGELESRDELKQRIEEASKFVDLSQLCLSPQCGFSSNAIGNIISEQEQFDKLGMIVELATEIWGGVDQ